MEVPPATPRPIPATANTDARNYFRSPAPSQPQTPSPPSSKRQRSNEDRDPELYIEDGNVILRAHSADTDSFVHFRVHKSTLAKHSPVFGGMLSIPEPATSDTYDGLPLVELHDDAEDVRAFLKILYEPFRKPFSISDADIAYTMYGPLKIATKYQFDILCEQVIAHIRSQWPQTLAEWDASEERIKTHLQNSPPNTLLDDIAPEPAAVIRIARECDIPGVLPMAFYHLSRLSIRAIHGGPNAGKAPPSSRGVTTRSCRRNLLTHADLECLAMGKERISRRVSNTLHTLLQSQRTSCICHASNCAAGFFSEVAKVMDTVAASMDSLKALEEAVSRLESGAIVAVGGSKVWAFEGGSGWLCSGSKKVMEETLKGLRESVFRALPEFFGVKQK